MKVTNKKARFNYTLEPERVEAGIALTGAEVKAVRRKDVELSASHARIVGGEAWLVNAKIGSNSQVEFPTRSRKLLLHKKELIVLEAKMKQKRLTLVPTMLYTKDRLVKLTLSLGKLKKRFEKRASLKKKDVQKDIERELKTRQK